MQPTPGYAHMSSSTPRKFTCPNCDLEQEFGVFENVNVTLEPAFKKQVLERTLSKFNCKGCGKSLTVRHPILYNDVKTKVIIWLPQGETKKPSIEEGSVVMNMMGKAGYRFRRVETYNHLVEKIRIFDDGHDDRALELLKLDFRLSRKGLASQKLFYDGLLQKGQSKSIRLVEVKKEGALFHEVPLEQLHRYSGVVAKAATADPAEIKWDFVDEKYAAQLLKGVGQ
jgi:hypothetical protein